jgi:hypothetical protein
MYLNFDEIMLAAYTNNKVIDYALSFEVSDPMYIKDPTKHNTSTLSLPESCRELYPPA